MQNKCLRILQRQLEEAGIESEIIVVEYNSNPEAPHLWESLSVEEGKHVTIRVIAVDPKYHRRFAHSDRRPFHQTCAINVGLRRSRGAFAVYRAADHIYSEALIRFLGGKRLAEKSVYRCDRLDIDPAALERVKPEAPGDISAVCEAYVTHWHRPLEVPPWYHIPTLHTNASGDCLLMSRTLWMRLRGLHEGRNPVFLDYDSLVLHAAHAAGAREEILPPECRVYKVDHGMKSIARLTQVWPERWKRLDTFLMSRVNNTCATWGRIALNYPRRRDRNFAGLLDSFERHFLFPAWLWSHGFPFVRQNLSRWGLEEERLPERAIARAAWDH